MNAPVDVLGRMAHAADVMEAADMGTVTVADLRAARAAVAALIEAAKECQDTELGDMACLGSDAPCEDALGRLFAALARVGGAA